MPRPAMFLLLLLAPAPAPASEYSDCVLAHLHDAISPETLDAIQTACRAQVQPAPPARCLLCPIHFNPDGSEQPYDPARGDCFPDPACATNCLHASYWSRHFGACRP